MSVKYDDLQELIANCVSPEYEPTERERGLPWQIRPAPCVSFRAVNSAPYTASGCVTVTGGPSTRAPSTSPSRRCWGREGLRRYYEVSPACLAAVDEVLDTDSKAGHRDRRKH